MQNGKQCSPSKSGRPPVLPIEGFKKLYEVIDKRGSELKALSRKEYREEIIRIIKEIRVENGGNNYGEVNVSVRTTTNIASKLNVIKCNGVSKSSSRIRAFNDIRNCISLCCLLNFVSHHIVRENLYSVDDVAVLLNAWSENQTEVIMTKESLKQLKKMNISPATEQTIQKQRIITFSCTISGDNKLVSTCIKFKDNSFIEHAETPYIRKLDDGLYIALYHPSMKDETLNYHVYSKTIIPEVVARRDNYLTSYVPVENKEEYESRFKYIGIIQDGAYGQISSIESRLYNECKEKNYNIIFGKWAAGCSLIQAPNDCGNMHKALKSLYKSPNYRSQNEYQEPNNGAWMDLKKILKRLETSSYNTIWKCLVHSSSFLSSAFNGITVQKGFNQMGLYNENKIFNSTNILGCNTHFRKLTQEDATWLILQLPRFYEHFEEHKFISEELFNTLQERVNVENHKKINKKHLNEMTTNRQRCMIIGDNTRLNYIQDIQVQKKKRKGRKNNETNKKKTKVRRYCSLCNQSTVITSNWNRCEVSRCTVWVCEKKKCKKHLDNHQRIHIKQINDEDEDEIEDENENDEDDDEEDDENEEDDEFDEIDEDDEQEFLLGIQDMIWDNVAEV